MIRAALSVVVLAVCLGGCIQNLERPEPSLTGNDAPVSLRDLQIQTADNHRAILLRLSRPPTLVRHSSEKKRITIEAWGPIGDGDQAWRTLEQSDPQITAVHVSRTRGALSVVVDFREDSPDYTLHEMADWIMVRFANPNPGGS